MISFIVGLYRLIRPGLLAYGLALDFGCRLAFPASKALLLPYTWSPFWLAMRSMDLERATRLYVERVVEIPVHP